MTATVNEPKVQRRRAGQVRTALLDSARKLFATKGFTGTSTRELAANAGVAETLIFRHFGSKAGIFHAAIIEPFRELVDGFVSQWEEYEPGSQSAEVLTADFVGSLYDALHAHRELVVALVAANAFEADANVSEEPITNALTEPLARLEEFTRREMAVRGFRSDPGVSARSAVGMVVAMAVLQDWFFPKAGRPSRDEAVEQMTHMILYGISE